MKSQAASPQTLHLSLRLDLAPGWRLGPGKVALLDGIATSGSISGAARLMGMSYRRAWILVDALNHMFHEPLVETQPGGARGGGARLTGLGQRVVADYRAIEAATPAAAAGPLAALLAAAQGRPA